MPHPSTPGPLAAFATPLQGRRGRQFPEPEDEFRNPFQRDRGRILFCDAFLRLQGKTQVFPAGESDHYRSRLTHSMSVASVSRDLARSLGLNEDLAECIALAHDLGHPPFGHSGEAALNRWMHMHDGFFEHNLQSFRIITLLEKHAAGVPGLNLSVEVVEGLLKHSTKHPITGAPIVHSPEAALVNLCDEVAYCAHDCDDGLKAGLFTLNDLITVPLVADARRLSAERHTYVRGAILGVLARDVLAHSNATKDTWHIGFSTGMRVELDTLKTFLSERLYEHPVVRHLTKAGEEIVYALCEKFYAHPNEVIVASQQRVDSTLSEAVKDYVSGMTDNFARLNAGVLGNAPHSSP